MYENNNNGNEVDDKLKLNTLTYTKTIITTSKTNT